MSKILDKLKANTKIKEADILADSKFFGKRELTSTQVPMINVALSGELDGGLDSGLTILAGPSKHFKTSYALLIAAAYLDKYKDAALLFYDSEFGSPQAYFESFGIDLNRVLHVPVKTIEELKFDMTSQLEALDKKDKVIIVIDSLGNIASKKELEDALNEKSVADMTRAKALKALFRMTTPYFTMKDVPCLGINHTYQEMGLFPKAIVSGGCLASGTKIITIDGPKEIENITKGDKVKTMSGFSEVSAVWNPDTLAEGNPECYEIEFADGYKVIVSNQHAFLNCDDEWVDAEDLKEGDYVLAVS